MAHRLQRSWILVGVPASSCVAFLFVLLKIEQARPAIVGYPWPSQRIPCDGTGCNEWHMWRMTNELEATDVVSPHIFKNCLTSTVLLAPFLMWALSHWHLYLNQHCPRGTFPYVTCTHAHVHTTTPLFSTKFGWTPLDQLGAIATELQPASPLSCCCAN